MEQADRGGKRLEHDEARPRPVHGAVPMKDLLQHLDVAHRIDAALADRPHERRGP